MPTCPTCQSQYPGGEGGCHCATCHESFTSNYTFDRHRVGPFEPPGLRRCLTPEELSAKGWVRRRLDAWGEPSTDRQMAHIARQPGRHDATEPPKGPGEGNDPGAPFEGS